jgi:UDP-glucose 4-epimerase
MKIIITGGAGFIGSHLIDKLLDEKNEIIVVSKTDSKFKNISHLDSKISINYIDITNYTKFGEFIETHQPDTIIHLAGETSHALSFENPLNNVDSNAKSTLFILEKIRQMNYDCKLILGSTFVVTGKPSELPVNEESQCNPTTIYGANRLASEHYCKIYENVYGIDTRIFRITNSFGPREQLIPKKNAVNYLIYNAFKQKEISIYNEGQFFRDLIYVDDVVSGIKTIMTNGKKGNLYWISSFEKTWFYQLAEWLNNFTGTPVNYVESPNYTKKVDVGNFLADNSKLKSIGWMPKYSVKEGIEKTLEYLESINA